MAVRLERSLAVKIAKGLSLFPAVAIVGARQVGKSTFAEMLGEPAGRHYVTLDHLPTLEAAHRDPHGFIDGLPKPVTIDEVQRVPKLLLAIKYFIDKNKKAGDFILTGSSRFEVIRGIKESLAGRIGMYRLFPLTATEMNLEPNYNAVDSIFSCDSVKKMISTFGKRNSKLRGVEDLAVSGGFPAVLTETPRENRTDWFEHYKRTYIEQDVNAIVTIQELPTFIHFFTAVCSATGSLLNLSDLARDCSISVDTTRRWLNVLESTFLVYRIPPYFTNIRKRLAKSPKLFLADSGLAAHVQGAHDWKTAERLQVHGQLLETWVFNQLQSMCETARNPTGIYFFRTYSGEEVDLVLERSDAAIGVEVKNSKSFSPKDLKGLEMFVSSVKNRRAFGIVLYRGDSAIPAGRNITAVPLENIIL